MLWLCLDFHRLPLELFLRAGEPADALVISSGGNRPQVIACDARAQAAGIHTGMALSAAYALSSRILVRVRDSAQELRALEATALWALQFTSHVVVSPPSSLLLEIGGSLRLFGGLDALRLRIRDASAELGFDAVIAVAPTPLGAQWLARAGLEATIADPASLRDRLGRLPVAYLESRRDALESFRRMGLRTLGEVARLPRDGLARRFGQALLDRLDRAYGALPDPQPTFIEPAQFRAALSLPSPVTEVEALLFAAHRLMLQMSGYLSARNAGAMRLKLAMTSEDGKTLGAIVALSVPSRDPKHLINLLRERLSLAQLPGRIETIALEALELAQLAPRNFSLFPDRDQSCEEKAVLVEKLRARLGDNAVHGLSLYPDARPELAWREAEPGTKMQPSPSLPRPTWLLPRPRHIDLRDGSPWLDGRLSLLDGPERIESGWWDGDDVMRDYFVARNADGATFWIYRERSVDGHWFLHGVFA